jgi:SAM-dependent methyltransferase
MSDQLSRQLLTMAPHRALLRAVEGRLMSAAWSACPNTGPTLDVGCGDGHFASIAYETPIDVGIDVRAAELQETVERGPSVYRSVALASATDLPFKDECFGVVLSNCAIEHIPDNEAVLRELSRVLRSGGVFLTTVPSENFATMLLGATLLRKLGAKGLAHRYGQFFNRISFHHHVYGPAEWERRMATHGLRVTEASYYFSARAHRAFDAAHYLGVPHLICRKLTGRWVIHPLMAWPYEKWLRRYYDESLAQERGAYLFLRCEKLYT